MRLQPAEDAVECVRLLVAHGASVEATASVCWACR